VLRADDARIQNPRGAGQRIDGGIDAALDDLAAEVGGGVQVCESRSRGWIRVIVSGHINGLHRRDGSGLRRSDALLEFADFGIEGSAVADGEGIGREARKLPSPPARNGKCYR